MKKLSTFVITGAALVLTACTGPIEEMDSEGNIDEVSLAASGNPNGENGLSTSYIRGLDRVELLRTHATDLVDSPLNSADLSTAIKNEVCGGTAPRRNTAVLKQIVQCALTPTQSVTFPCSSSPGGQWTIQGHAGVHSQWATSACTGACQSKVSACVIAMTNFSSEEIKIDLASAAPSMNLTKAASGYDRVEGAYWGNIFSTPYEDVNGCYAPDSTNWAYNSTVWGANVSLMNRACQGFDFPQESNYQWCIVGTPTIYFNNINPANNNVRPCDVACASRSAAGNYTDCGSNSTDFVVTVRRKNTDVYPMNLP